MKKLHKILALALVLCMCVGFFAFGASAEPVSTPYTDVDPNAAYAEAVALLTEKGIMQGISADEFGPELSVNRAQAITVLGRLAGAETVETNDFSDVQPNSFYSGYVGWAVENGIVEGDGKGHFMPALNVTSAHLNLMLTRYAELIGVQIDFYDTGASTVARADLAQRLVKFLDQDAAPSESTVTVPAVVGLGDKGYIMGYETNGIYTFKGIHYGTAERFMRAEPVAYYGSEENPANALTNGAVSPQGGTSSESSKFFLSAAFMTPSDSDMFSIEGSCLNLNVWTDTLDESANKPVLVFFHGGGTTEGSAVELKMYDGSYFADYTNVVFVSVNARLNYLGYADLTELGGESNLGLSDMVLSLEWVKEHISSFGGNPDNVTIMGQSGGGTKVSALASSPKALEENLFQRVIIASGYGATARTPEYTASQARAVANSVKASDVFINYIRTNASELGLEVTDDTAWGQLVDMAANASDEVVFTFLQNVDYDTLGTFGLSTGTLTGDDVYFSTSLQGTSNGQTVYRLSDANGMNDIAKNYTYMIGSAWAEMGGRNSADAVLGYWDNTGLPGEAVINLTEEEKRERMESYLEGRVGGYDETKAAFEAAYPGHDFYDLRSIQTTNFASNNSSLQAVQNAEKVYNYFSAYTMPYFGGLTMIHTGDLAYFFHSIETSPYQISGDEENAWKVADTMASALAAFCTNGDPSIAGLTWEPYNAEDAHTMIFDVDSRCVTADFNAELRELIARSN